MLSSHEYSCMTDIAEKLTPWLDSHVKEKNEDSLASAAFMHGMFKNVDTGLSFISDIFFFYSFIWYK